MNMKIFCIAIITLLFLCDISNGKKSRKNKRPKVEEDYTTLQPNVVTYSTFGFNDVGSYDGFIPTSPDYANFLSNVGQESTTRLYAPAFPSAIETTGYSGNSDSSSFTGQSSGTEDDTVLPSGMFQYTSNSMNVYNAPSYGFHENQGKKVAPEDVNEHNIDEPNTLAYGTKINSRHRSKSPNELNNTDFGKWTSSFVNLTNDKYFSFLDESVDENKPSTYSESKVHLSPSTDSYISTHPTVEMDDFDQSLPNQMQTMNLPKVIDFTKYYPTDLDTDKIPDYTKFMSNQNIISNAPTDNVLTPYNNKFMNSKPSLIETYDLNNNEVTSTKNFLKESNSNAEQNFKFNNAISQGKQNAQKTKLSTESKKKIKVKPWLAGNNGNYLTNWRDSSPAKEYGYSTNFSNIHFKYGTGETRKPFNSIHDEVLPASSNVVDLTNYEPSEMDFNKFKKMPEFSDDEEYPSFSRFKEKSKHTDYFKQFKNSFSTEPTTTSYWGNAFMNNHYSLFRDHLNKPFYNENNNEDVVNIPKLPTKSNFPKSSEYNHVEWASLNHRPHKNKPVRDWTTHFSDSRYKSEEDLLDLRNHDTSHPVYIPTYNPSANADNSETDFKKLVEKWKQSYLQSKYKDLSLRDYGNYGTDIKPIHVPYAKPYPIEVPHPVVVPVPRPYPVRVPVARPVAVPVVRELTVPIMKPVPYPVIKNVPYPIEKLVPVPVEKEVAVPVEKPYPVRIPHVKPLFHHIRPVYEDPETDSLNEEEDFTHRPEYKKPPPYKKRPYNSRDRSRRPSRTAYQERNRRRWPERRRPSGQSTEHSRYARPYGYQHAARYKYHDNEPDTEEERLDYTHCRRTGKCW